MRCWNGKEGGTVGVYPGVGGALLPPLFLTVRVCNVYKGRGGEIEAPCTSYFMS